MLHFVVGKRSFSLSTSFMQCSRRNSLHLSSSFYILHFKLCSCSVALHESVCWISASLFPPCMKTQFNISYNVEHTTKWNARDLIAALWLQRRTSFASPSATTTWRHAANHHPQPGRHAQRLGAPARLRLQRQHGGRHGTLVTGITHLARVTWYTPIAARQSDVPGHTENSSFHAGDGDGGRGMKTLVFSRVDSPCAFLSLPKDRLLSAFLSLAVTVDQIHRPMSHDSPWWTVWIRGHSGWVGHT